MAPRHMTENTASRNSGRDELEAAGIYSPPLHPRPAGHPSPWATFLRSRERRLWTLALAVVLLAGATAVGLISADDLSKQATIRSLQTSNESVTGRNLILQDQVQKTQSNLTASLQELANTRAQLDHPTVVTWNKSQTIPNNMTYLAAGAPDAFTLHLRLTSSGPIDVSIESIEAFASGVDCVRNGQASTDWCMHRQQGIDVSWLGKTSITYDFHKAEGCADYVVVVTAPSAATVTPNVSVTYNPATGATGTCA